MEKVKQTKPMVYIALFVVVMALCSWISIPSFIPFTLQLFAIASALLLLGGKYGTAAVFVYLLLGLVGLPVFSFFTGGIGAFASPNGGFLFGFLMMAILYWMITSLFKDTPASRICGFIFGMLMCYLCGITHYVFGYLPAGMGINGAVTALSTCVLPFIIPDAIKITLAFLLSNRITKHIKL